MSYKKSVYIKAKQILDARRETALKAQEIRHSQVAMEYPELLEIEREMAQCGADTVKAIGMGADAVEFIRQLSIKSLNAQDRKKALLQKAGYTADYLEPAFTCPVCKDTGSHDGYYCQCYKKLIREVASDELSSASPLKRCTFQSFSLSKYADVTDKTLGVNQREHMSKVYEYCKAYAEDFTTKSKNLLMMGATGLGKTHLSLAIANRVIEKGYDVYYDSIQNIMDKLEKEHFGRLPREESIKDDILSCDLLIIDDLGVEFTTQFTVAELHSIINTRILRCLPTIISTNLELSDIEKQYSQRIASRIIGTSMPLRFCGNDIRQMM